MVASRSASFWRPRTVALLTSWVIRLWLGTLDIRVAMANVDNDPRRAGRRQIYLLWHENLLLPAFTHARYGVSILISKHRDGELIAQVVRLLGGQAVRGSTNRGGITALRSMMRVGRGTHLAITPDGPRGPRRTVSEGAIFLASRMGMPLVPVGLACDRCWRAPSWDKMVLPRPGQRAAGVFGEAIDVPERLDRGQIEAFCRRVQAAMDDVQDQAERMADGQANRPDAIPLVRLRDERT
jgi:lysophospholipid acyltransferase (LPLAT)-like uncharacterized protein